MKTRTCPECGHDFETVTNSGPCGLRRCPSAGGGAKPQRTTASGKAIDDRRARSGAKRQTTGYVEQRSTGIGFIDAIAGFNRKKRKR